MPRIQVKDSAWVHFTIAERLKFYNVPSVSIAVINNGKVAWAKAYGLADVGSKRPATPLTMYQAASISKTVNAVAVMRLVQQHRLSLDTDIRHYLKTWTFPDNEFSKGSAITLKNLLTHTAGINVPGFMGYKRGATLPSLNEILNGTAPANNEAIRPIHPPGAEAYSGGGIMIVQKILEDQVNPDYAGFMETEVLGPLAMHNSTYAMPLPPSLDKKSATGYDNHLKATSGKYFVYPELAPAGLWTTPKDFAQLVVAIQAALKGEDSKFLTKENAATLLKPVSDSTNTALGSFIYKIGGDTYFTHLGHNAGFLCAYYGSVTTGKGLVIMVNSDNDGIMPEILRSVAVTYHWKDFYKPEIKTVSTIPPDSLLNTYVGEYYCEKLKKSILIQKRSGYLEVRQELEFNKGDSCFEKAYFTNDHTFFVNTSDLVWEFQKTPIGNGLLLNIADGNDHYAAVKK